MDTTLMAGGMFLLMVAVYFAPGLVAEARGRDGKNMIGLLNLLLGWTVIGWVVLLVVAFTGRSQRDRDQQDEQLELMRKLVAQQSLNASAAGAPLAAAPHPAPPVPPAAPPPPPMPEPTPAEDTRTLAEIMADEGKPA